MRVSITARILAADEAESIERQGDLDLQRLMAAIRDHPGASIQKLADACRAFGQPGWSKTSTYARMQTLRKLGLAEGAAGIWTLTPKGKRVVDNA